MITSDEIVPVILVMNDEFFLPYSLESIKGRFARYVIYDIGSTDRTRDILHWFLDTSPKETSFVYRELPFVEPRVQGVFRNSMIAEALSDWIFILDGDEIYTPESLDNLILEMENMKELFISKRKTYGIVRRVEVGNDLCSAYGQDLTVPHHRMYHRKMIWAGPHPGEYPLIEQTGKTDHWFSKKVDVYHMHNCSRSSVDDVVPKRLTRRGKGTYSPGESSPINIFEKLPLLREPIEDFPVSPALAKLQEAVK